MSTAMGSVQIKDETANEQSEKSAHTRKIWRSLQAIQPPANSCLTIQAILEPAYMSVFLYQLSDFPIDVESACLCCMKTHEFNALFLSRKALKQAPLASQMVHEK